MKNPKMFTVAALLTMLFVFMSACSDAPEEDTSNQSGSDTIPASTDDSSSESTMEADNNEENQSEESLMEDHTPKTKIEGRTEFLNKLDNIQKELDAMPDKKDSDKGVTNAMKNYYGVSYEKFDDALNEIYTLLKKELSPEVMKELQAEQLRWIEQKETKAEKERLKYEGGTFENVAWYISLYESTKDRCYELVNEYMTD
ncbi:lysozyme inhibitor LprI family protein [uncultured Rossellomorea sp.]|uniref:lysozyme inhibitor LprI family protein n=1 Tax=uncultured Rossellomorea sp. TaxID=2837549 RepID=UPI00260C32B6|nr:lysozyme inhibitor LprI family protein [uncultured Rossellomorea sp.]